MTLLQARELGKLYPDATLRRRKSDRWSLRGVDLDVHPGEIVAVIGRNGAGKSTLLKLAAGVTHPTEGSIVRTRNVAPLIEVGAGFHPELSGRENVTLNGRLLGMSRKQIASRFDSIVAFSELGHVIDNVVKTYSSGMYMRLGFSVAVHTEPDLLLVDEVLAVGDLPFQLKCLDRIREMQANGTGILFVSHNLAAVQSLASRGVLLEGGTDRLQGEVREVIGAYHELLALEGRGEELGEDNATTSAGVRIRSKSVCTLDGGPAPALWHPGDRVVIRLELEAMESTGPCVIGATMYKDGAGMIGSWLGHEAPRVAPMERGEVRVSELAVSLNVGPGSYTLDVGLANADFTTTYFEEAVAHFPVGNRPGSSGLVDFAPTLLEP